MTKKQTLMTLALAFLIMATIFPPVAAEESVCCNITKEIIWDSDVIINENFTLEPAQRLIIEPGVNVTLREGVFMFIKGQLYCGERRGENVTITGTNGQSGIITLNSCLASFRRTSFQEMDRGIISVYTKLRMEECIFSEGTMGVFAYECKVEITDTRMSGSTFGAELVRSNVMIDSCNFKNVSFPLDVHTEPFQKKSYDGIDLWEVPKLKYGIDDEKDMILSIYNTDISRSSVGVRIHNMTKVATGGLSLENCDIGMKVTNSPGTFELTEFENNVLDIHAVGWNNRLIDNVTEPQSIEEYIIVEITLNDENGSPLVNRELMMTGSGLEPINATTDVHGKAKLQLLDRSLHSGVEKEHVHILKAEGIEGTLEIRPSQEEMTISGNEFKTEETGLSPWILFLIPGILVFLIIFAEFRKFKRKK